MIKITAQETFRLLYGTDFHGDIKKYEDALNFAMEHKIKLIHLGADILPKGSNILKSQKKFVQRYLKEYFDQCKKEGITILASFGNDDIYTRKKYFKKYANLLDEVPYRENGYKFKAYAYVQDYPFGLKTACKLDYMGWKCQEDYFSSPIDFDETSHYIIEDIDKYFLEKGTIEEDLKNIHADNKTIMAIHQPPYALNLDMCTNGRHVGSRSVFEWISREQPLILLSGHIHESYEVTKVWKVMVGNTAVIQPGQTEDYTTMVYIEIFDDKVNTQLVII